MISDQRNVCRTLLLIFFKARLQTLNLAKMASACCLSFSQLLNFSTFQSFIFFGSLIQYDFTFSKLIDVVPEKSLSRFVRKLFKYLLFFWTILSFTSGPQGLLSVEDCLPRMSGSAPAIFEPAVNCGRVTA